MIDRFAKRTENNTSAWLAFSLTADELWKIRGWGKSITNAPSYLTEKCEFGGFSLRAVHVVQEWL